MRLFVLLTSRELIERRKGIHARFIVGSLLVSRSIRRDSVACLYLAEGYAILFYGSKIRHLRADEASAFGIVRKALRKLESRNPHPGVYTYRTDLLSTIRRAGGDSMILVRDDRLGRPIGDIMRSFSPRFSSIVYITCLCEFRELMEVILKCSNTVLVRFPRRLSPEQEVVILNILLDQIGL